MWSLKASTFFMDHGKDSLILVNVGLCTYHLGFMHQFSSKCLNFSNQYSLFGLCTRYFFGPARNSETFHLLLLRLSPKEQTPEFL